MSSIENISDEVLNNMSKEELSNLLTDLAIQGASESVLSRVVERSMVVIDESRGTAT